MAQSLLLALQRKQAFGMQQVGDTSGAASEMARARRRVASVEASTGLASVRGVLCDQARLRIVSALEGARLPVSALATVIGRQVPATSQHLRVLRELGLVSARQSGSQVYYSLRSGAATAQVRVILAAMRRTISPPS